MPLGFVVGEPDGTVPGVVVQSVDIGRPWSKQPGDIGDGREIDLPVIVPMPVLAADIGNR